MPDARWTHVTTGSDHTCAARTDGKIFCWGGNALGQLGVGDTSPRLEPTFVMEAGTVESLHTRGGHTCVVHDDGDLTCWGANFEGELGLVDAFDSPDRLVPTPVPTDKRILGVFTGDGHTLVIGETNLIAGTGRNNTAQLGLGDQAAFQLRELTVIDPLGTWTNVAGGQNHSCGVRDAQLLCWGENVMGQLGTGDVASHSTPTSINTEIPWLAVDVNAFHSCAVARDGRIACWGRNIEGQLGLGDGNDRLAITPTGFDDWTAVATGRFHTIGLRADGSVWVTGDNPGFQLGTGDGDRRLTWTQILP